MLVKIIVMPKNKKLLKGESLRNFLIHFSPNQAIALICCCHKWQRYVQTSQRKRRISCLSQSFKMNLIVIHIAGDNHQLIESASEKRRIRLLDGPRRHGNAAYPHICFCCSPFGNENDVTLGEDTSRGLFIAVQ